MPRKPQPSSPRSKPGHKRVGGKAQEDIHENIIPPRSRRKGGRPDVMESAMGGAGDGNSGAGNGAGIPDGDTGLDTDRRK